MAAPLQIDSRQQASKHVHKNRWFAAHGIETVGKCLDFGDYMVAGSNISVDTKKDVDELALDLGRDHARFVRECDRAAAAGYRLVVLVEQHPEFNDRARLFNWRSYACRRCGGCDPNRERCVRRRFKPMCGSTLLKIMAKVEKDHGARFEFCSKRVAARRICELLGIGYE